MALGKGAKIAIGCGVAFIVFTVGVALVLFGAAWWGIGRAKQVAERMAGEQQKIEELHTRANANPFTPPAGGAIQEDRLVRFLAVRKQVFAVYESHKAEFDAMDKRRQGGLEGLKALGQLTDMINEARLARAQALAERGMSEAEYRFFVENVYKSMWASELAKSTGGKSVSEATGDSMEKAAEEAERAAEEAEQSGQPVELVQQLKESARQIREQAKTSREEAKKLDVPPETIALYRKHEDDIKKYAMSGLEWLGL